MTNITKDCTSACLDATDCDLLQGPGSAGTLMVHTTTTNSHGLSSASMTNRSAMVVISSDAQHPGAALRWHPYLRTTLTRLWTNFRGAATGSCQNSPIRRPHFGASAASQIYEPEAAVVADPSPTEPPASACARFADASTPTQCHHRPATLPGVLLRSADCYATRRHRPGLPQPHRIGARPARGTPAGPARPGRLDPHRLPRIISDGLFQTASHVRHRQHQVGSRRAVAGQWQRRRLLTRVDPNDNRQQGQLQQGLANVLDGASSRAGTAIRLADVHYNRVDVHRDNLPDEVDISVGSFQESSEYGVPVAMGPPAQALVLG